MASEPHPDSAPIEDDGRSNIEQAVEARSDALKRGDGGREPDGVGTEGGAGGEVRNQDVDAQ